MLKAYVNYPNPHVTIHTDLGCSAVQKQGKPGQRVARVDAASFSAVLVMLEQGHYRFGADSATNDMWLEVDFGDREFERAVVRFVKEVLARRYAPFGRAPVNSHC